jgi:hypothetical protein
MASEDTSDWLFESIIGFLKSPLWINPIHSFIDEKCLIFNNEDENKFTYTEVHNQFREMIDSLLELHLSDMSVSPEQVCIYLLLLHKTMNVFTCIPVY